MRFIHAFGYAIAALFAATIGTSLAMGSATLYERLAISTACAALGAYVGWNRKR